MLLDVERCTNTELTFMLLTWDSAIEHCALGPDNKAPSAYYLNGKHLNHKEFKEYCYNIRGIK